MPTCSHCGVVACTNGSRENLPKNCPMLETETMDACLARYREEDNAAFFRTAAAIEAEGYCQWPRLREVGEFCRAMRYRRVGVAFCIGLKREAETVVAVLGRFGLEVDSVVCKTGGIDKTRVGIEREHYVRPGGFEAMCNPIAQAEFLNRAGTEFNVAVGLCVGHDSLFFKYSKAPVTVLVAKDRALAHNPAGAIYCAGGYFKDRLAPAPAE